MKRFFLSIGMMVLFTTQVLSQNTGVKMSPTHHLKIGMILPFEGTSAENARMVEYYQGFLMAVDSLKQIGYDTDVYAYDSGKGEQELHEVLNTPTLQQMDVLFGPMYPDQVKGMADFANRHHIPLVLPFSSKSFEVETNPDIIQVGVPRIRQNKEAVSLFVSRFRNHHIVFVQTGKTDRADFTDMLKQRLGVLGIVYQSIPVNAGDDEYASCIRPGKQTVFVPGASGIESINMLLPRLRDLKRNQAADYCLFGYPEWQTYTQNHLEDFYTSNTYLFTTFYRNPVSASTSQFERAFRKQFHHDMIASYPRFAMLGFDTGFHVLNTLFRYGKAHLIEALPTLDYQGYQNPLRMEKASAQGGVVNTFTQLIHYLPSHRIESIVLE